MMVEDDHIDKPFSGIQTREACLATESTGDIFKRKSTAECEYSIIESERCS